MKGASYGLLWVFNFSLRILEYPMIRGTMGLLIMLLNEMRSTQGHERDLTYILGSVLSAPLSTWKLFVHQFGTEPRFRLRFK
ncbi:hypothetical protein CJ030_MR8G020605 [Morella rubra]|uniref:Uncharacterized protein n=1 Tax=Morella rubra TaxID=262757 RepID=A0A6A1UW35_9ROSI|nr:hypothetical protein CJ030_MR8G020605 [Morella rubra]